MPVFRLTRELRFPDPELAEDGLLAIGGDLRPERLLLAYRSGIFPWFGVEDPLLWWSPPERAVLRPGRLHLPERARRSLRRRPFEARFDTAFDEVIAACAASPRPGQDGTWIVPGLIEAYRAWHRLGRVHSIETWIDGQLAGGLYGVGIGRVFFGESMFARRTDASKIALAALVAFCRQHGIALIDCQQRTGHLASLGAREIPREAFERHLAQALGEAPPPRWTYDERWWTHLALGGEPPHGDHRA